MATFETSTWWMIVVSGKETAEELRKAPENELSLQGETKDVRILLAVAVWAARHSPTALVLPDGSCIWKRDYRNGLVPHRCYPRASDTKYLGQVPRYPR